MAQAVSSGEVAVTRVVDGGGTGGVDLSISGEDDKSVRMDEGAGVGSNCGNRWPRQETLALLRIRSEMDAVFRDSSLKGPLWEEVSRKLGEMGFHRSAKKCKEKFENVYKYHKRTKEGRAGKSEGKAYRFFDQLEAFQHNPSHPASAPPPTPPPISQNPMPTTTAAAAASSVLPWNTTTTTTPPNINGTHHQVTVPLTTKPPMNINNSNIVSQNHIITPTSDSVINPSHQHTTNLPISSFQTITTHLFSSSSTSSSTASDEDFQGSRNKRKRKWKDFFERLTRDVIKKQEELQNKFLETVEKRERERMAREDAWRKQEMSRINREHEILIQERSNAAAKDAAVVAFLQKMSSSGEQQQQQHISSSSLAVSVQPTVQAPPPQPPPPPASRPTPTAAALVSSLDFQAKDNNGGNAVGIGSTSSRWPKSEVEALIRLRSTLDTKYQENAPKGPLWEEISSGMRQLGYNRSAKRCKEKWENINKYFKKVKESNKKRAVDSKTCPYFDQLDALYKEKNKSTDHPQQQQGSVLLSSSGYPVKPISTVEPLMAVHPAQHWPPPLLQQENQPKIDSVVQDNGRTELQNVREGEEDDNDDDDDDDDDVDDYEDTEEEDHGGGFEVVANKPTSSVGNGKVFN